ncbi:MAG TPA: EAL domain-containing protein [Rhodopila sp.]|nr:EAL domain-containing protein [Rhodopila sp.]
MIRIIGCITQQHDLKLVLLAAVICCFACFTTINLLSRASSHRSRLRMAWLTGAAVVFGSGVWSTHFVAMLAFQSDLILGYAVHTTALSFVMVCVGAVAAFSLALQDVKRPVRTIAAGVLLGGGVGAMHYTGIGAMHLHGIRSFQSAYVIASIAAGMMCSCAALRDIWASQDLLRRLRDAGWLSVGIVLLHFTAMTALSIQPAPADAATGLLIGSTLLATIITAVSALILALSLFGSIVDQYLSQLLAREESSLHHLAHHDALTGLPNRLQCHERLAEMVEMSSGGETCAAVLCLDLDRFKQVNDLLGHRAGDQLLIQVAARLQSLVRPTDLVARIGGDEFVIAIAPPITAAWAGALAGRIVDALGEPFWLDGQQVGIGTSIGLALGPADGSTGADLLRNADTALYQAKKDGRGLYRFFEASMNERLRYRQLLEQDLRQGIQDGHLELHYQPLLDVQTKKVTGFEALARWRHPTRGLVPPGEFIPLAEESGLIVPLGRWVLEAACREAASWHLPLRIAVNVSPVQFRQPDLADTIISVIAQTGLAPQRLEIEVTESVLIRHADQAVETLERLRDHGVNISLDDFGTGYSSLSYLRRFPFNKIKLDRSFIQGLGEDKEAAVITRAIVALGRSLSLVVTAEGVETSEQLDFLAAEDCDQIQGYLVSKPLPASDIADLTRS